MSITAGLRFDVPVFENTAYNNANANALTFRDETGAPVQYDSGKMPGANILWSPRLGFNYDVNSDQKTQIRGGTGVFTGQPLYVWISNQLGNTGVLQGSTSNDTASNQTTTQFPFSTNVDRYKPTNVTGAPAASYELNVTDENFRFPQVWRSNLAVDRRLPRRHHRHRGVHLQPRRQRHLLHQRQPAGGADGVCRRRHPAALDQQPHQQRHRQPGDERDRDEEPGHRPRLEPRVLGVEADVARPVDPHRLQLRRSQEHHRPGLDRLRVVVGQRLAGRSRTTRAWATRVRRRATATSPASATPSDTSSWGATSVSLFWEIAHDRQHQLHLRRRLERRRRNGDLIYIPRNTSEMNFAHVHGGRDHVHRGAAGRRVRATSRRTHLSAHRGEYAQRGAVFLPLVHRADFSLTQDVQEHQGQAQRRPVPHRRPELRQPAQLRLGRRHARHPQQHPDNAGGRRGRTSRLSHAGGEQRAGEPVCTSGRAASPTSTSSSQLRYSFN